MSLQIAELSQCEQSNGGGGEKGAGRCSSRRIGPVDPVGDVQTTEDPVVSRVLEDVTSRHGGIGEAVDEKSFELTLEEVQEEQDAGECLGVRCGTGIGVEVWPEEVEERVNEHWAEIFNNKDGLPCYLRTEVLDQQNTVILQAGSLNSEVLGIGNDGAITIVGEAKSMH